MKSKSSLRPWLVIKNGLSLSVNRYVGNYRRAWRVPGYRALVVYNAGGEREMILMRSACRHRRAPAARP
jgi:hypothetical protein